MIELTFLLVVSSAPSLSLDINSGGTNRMQIDRYVAVCVRSRRGKLITLTAHLVLTVA